MTSVLGPYCTAWESFEPIWEPCKEHKLAFNNKFYIKFIKQRLVRASAHYSLQFKIGQHYSDKPKCFSTTATTFSKGFLKEQQFITSKPLLIATETTTPFLCKNELPFYGSLLVLSFSSLFFVFPCHNLILWCIWSVLPKAFCRKMDIISKKNGSIENWGQN